MNFKHDYRAHLCYQLRGRFFGKLHDCFFIGLPKFYGRLHGRFSSLVNR
jgi:hypothetical protein